MAEHEQDRVEETGAEEQLHVKADGPYGEDEGYGFTVDADAAVDTENWGNDTNDATTGKKKPGVFARFLQKLGLDVPTVATMFKGSIPPTIGVAMYQSDWVANYFSTLGYLIPIISVLALAILPRGKYIQNLILNLATVAVGAAMGLLIIWSSVQARIHTTPAGTSVSAAVTYNSSQSAVCGVWLFFNIWAVNMLRAKAPAFNLPSIIYCIFINISATFGPLMTTTAQAEAFVRELLVAMLVALALATAVNFLVFPVSNRRVLFKQFAGVIGLLRKAVAQEKTYLRSLEGQDMFVVATRDAAAEAEERKLGKNSKPLTREQKAAKAVRETTTQIRELGGKIQGDITFAKRDIAWGKLDAKDLGEIYTLIRNIYIPITGISSIMDIFKRLADRRGWDVEEDEPGEVVFEKEHEKRVWNEVMKQMHEPFEILSQAMDQGLEHAAIFLEILPRPKAGKKTTTATATGDGAIDNDVDVEARGCDLQPGDLGFGKIIDEKVKTFFSRNGELLRTWVKERGLADMEEEEEEEREVEREARCASDLHHLSPAERHERDQAQLYVILYMETLMHAAGEAVEDLVDFAENKVRDGSMAHNRLIRPSENRLRKWFFSVFRGDGGGGAVTAEQVPDLMEGPGGAANIVFLGDGYNRKKDPEHLPPATRWQHFGNYIRKFSKLFASEESAFGFRVACATMTVGIVAFLESTQVFFLEQRLVWAMIITALGMTMTSGQSFFGFICRVGGTFIAMCLSLVIWYIVDEKTPGVIVFLWLSIFIDYYFFLKFPRFLPAIMITIITQVLIVGYELQVVKIGEAAASRLQPYYPTYELAPYRLACVAGGSLVAFLWTIFPSSLTERTWLRRDLSATLYLLANYFSVINSTMQSKFDKSGGDKKNPNSPAHKLAKVRRKLWGKMNLLLPSLSQHAEWQKYEPTIGGKFPREVYEDIIFRVSRVLGYLTLMSYTLTHPPRCSIDEEDGSDTESNHGEEAQAEAEIQPAEGNDDNHEEITRANPVKSNRHAWLSALSEVLETIEPTHFTILSTLTLLSNSLYSGQSLPPFLPLPQPYEMTRRLMRLGPNADDDRSKMTDIGRSMLGVVGTSDCEAVNILDARNMEQPGYAEFAVLQVCSMLVCDDLEGLVRSVSSLVGVVDFSYKIDTSQDSLTSTSGSEGGDVKAGGASRSQGGKGKKD